VFADVTNKRLVGNYKGTRSCSNISYRTGKLDDARHIKTIDFFCFVTLYAAMLQRQQQAREMSLVFTVVNMKSNPVGTGQLLFK